MVYVRTLLGAATYIGESAVIVRDLNYGEDSLQSVASAETVAFMDSFTNNLFDPAAMEGSDVHEAMHTISSKMDVHTAIKVSGSNLPKEVTSLAQTVDAGQAVDSFDEGSMEKARIALNELVEKAWKELDDKIFKCKGFQDMNRETYGQVKRDIMRLIEQINDLERVETEAVEGIAEKDQEILDLKALRRHERQEYKAELATNQADLTIKQNDLDVFTFILKFTKCKDATSLSQTRVCEMKSGRKTILFGDKATASQYKKMLTPRAKRSIDQILRQVEGETKAKVVSFIQQPTANGTTPPLAEKVEVVGEDTLPCLSGAEGGEGDADECMKSCGPDPPCCGCLHDKLSLMWGEYKDQVDELTMTMLKNEVEWNELKDNINSQIRMLVAAKARLTQLLAEARSNLAADRSELEQKNTQKRKLDTQYYTYMKKCKARIQWIMYQDMCAIKVVRNAVLENSTECPSATIMDCDLDNWVKHPCSVSCDDSCDPEQPFKCGGWAKMTRQVVTQPDKCGIKCPLTERYIRCGQFLCPIDCHQSSWSSYSKCTADCEGGLQGRTRSIEVKPKNGGKMCGTVEETRACNTGSCDRDCTLQKWTKWTPCTMACSGGFQHRVRHVLIPTRGEGKCWKEKSAKRFEERMCNTQACNGDEICIAKQDLIMAVDGSGSVTEDGFKVLKDYTLELLKRYQPEYFGQSAMKIGLLQFGNGVLADDGKTVSPARTIQTLTADVDKINKGVEGLEWKRGFTNMAQAFSLAEDMFIKKSRKSAQQAVMLITDGKPSFAWQTNEMVEQLDDKNIQRYFIVINDEGPNSDVMKQMRQWASQPWETNLIHIQGTVMLEADREMWAERALVKFCPQAYSPTTAGYEEETYGYQHVKDSGWCGEQGQLLGTTATNADACAALAAGVGAHSFMLGTWFRRGYCYAGTMEVSSDQYAEWQANKVNPKCKTGWVSSMLYDFYAAKVTSSE